MNEPRPGFTVQSTAEIFTANAELYLAQLCKHFRHKLSVTYDERSGLIAFPVGDCSLRANDEVLTVSAEAADHPQLAALQEVVERHLLRFAFREAIHVDWRTTRLTGGSWMDSRIEAVLDAYHARIDDERRTRNVATQAGLKEMLRDNFMLAVGPDTGRLINILARSLKTPHILELGTSYGYSTIWLAEAARAAGGRVTTMETQDYKATHAREMAAKAGLADVVAFQVGDALELIPQLTAGIDFVLVDLWKDRYLPCLEAVLPKLNPGAILVADNMIVPGAEGTVAYAAAIRARVDMSSILVPVGTGLEISRYTPG